MMNYETNDISIYIPFVLKSGDQVHKLSIITSDSGIIYEQLIYDDL